MEEKNQTEKPKCPKCNSSFGYFRIKEKKWVCRTCGHIEKNKEDQE
jgi:ribosomal protein L37AE/L43A